MFNQNNILMANPFKVGMLYRPVVLDNKKFWKVFESDEQITKFIGIRGIEGGEARMKNTLSEYFD